MNETLKEDEITLGFTLEDTVTDMALAAELDFRTLVQEFISEAQSLVFSKRNVKRLSFIYEKLVIASGTAKEFIGEYTNCFYDPDDENAETYQQATEIISTGMSIFSNNYTEVISMLENGEYLEIGELFAGGAVMRRFETAITATNDALELAGLSKILVARKAECVTKNLKEYCVSQMKGTTAKELADEKKTLIEQSSALKKLTEATNSIKDIRVATAKFRGDLMKKGLFFKNSTQALKELVPKIKATGNVDLSACQRKVKYMNYDQIFAT